MNVVITGGSKGIGKGMALEFLKRGHSVAICSRGQKDIDATIDELNEHTANGQIICGTSCDVADYAQVQNLWDFANDKMASVDIWINNAGAIPAGDITTIDEKTWRTAWDLKVFGYINLCREIYPTMTKRGHGVIINVIGAAAVRPQPSYIAGAVGNSGLVGLTTALGSRSLNYGVRVVAVNPGLIVTDRMEDILRREAIDQLNDEERWAELIPDDPAPGSVEQCADVITFLASSRASHISGTTLTIDGGASAR